MGINDCSELCEFCKSNGHCSTRCNSNEFQFDEEKFKSTMENWWNTNVAMPLRRGLRLDQEEEKEDDNNGNE